MRREKVREAMKEKKEEEKEVRLSSLIKKRV